MLQSKLHIQRTPFIYHFITIIGGLLFCSNISWAQQECPTANQYWESLSKAGIQDSVLDLAVHPTDVTTIYVGFALSVAQFALDIKTLLVVLSGNQEQPFKKC